MHKNLQRAEFAVIQPLYVKLHVVPVYSNAIVPLRITDGAELTPPNTTALRIEALFNQLTKYFHKIIFQEWLYFYVHSFFFIHFSKLSPLSKKK